MMHASSFFGLGILNSSFKLMCILVGLGVCLFVCCFAADTTLLILKSVCVKLTEQPHIYDLV